MSLSHVGLVGGVDVNVATGSFISPFGGVVLVTTKKTDSPYLIIVKESQMKSTCLKRGRHQWRTCGRIKDKRVSVCEVCGESLMEKVKDRVKREFK